MCAIPQLVSAPLYALPIIVEHLRRSHPPNVSTITATQASETISMKVY